MFLTAFLILALVLSFARVGWSQEVTGALEGRILGADNEPLSAVRVTTSGSSLQLSRVAGTDGRGYFRILALPVGTYTVGFRYIGYRSARYDSVVVRLGRTTNLGELRLEPQRVELPELVVSGEPAIIDLTSTAIGLNLTAETFEGLPNERNFRSMAALSPSANASFFPGDEINIAGGTGPENMYFVDGINVTDPNRGATSTNLPYNFVKELEIKTGGYEAEYGRALGGIVSVVTYSGSNEFHGQGFGFFANEALTAASRRGVVEGKVGDFSQYDFGVSIGGPIRRDRLWFFGAYNPTFEDREIELPGIGFRKDGRQLHLFAGKLTWQAGPATDLVFTMLGDPTTQDHIGQVVSFLGSTPSGFANPEPVLGMLDEGGVNLLVKAHHRAGSRLLLEGALARFARNQHNFPRTEQARTDPVLIDQRTGIWSGGYGGFVRNYMSRSSASISGSAFLGNHALKAGVAYEDNFLEDSTGLGGLTFGGGGFLFRENDTSYTWFLAGSAGKVHNRVPSVYLQDSWMVAARLRLNAGLRWDGQFLISPNGRVAQRITNQFQPRIGFIYQLGKPGSQKLFGSFGRFYEQLGNFISSVYHARGENTFIHYDHNPLVDRTGADTLFSINLGGTSEIPNLQGEHYDEFIVGYERRVENEYRVAIRGIHRKLQQVIDDALDPLTGEFVIGNPGRGKLSFLPPPKRDYTALELTLEKFRGEAFKFLASYVLSRNYGNYTGVYSTELEVAGNTGPQFDFPELIPNNAGLLPNDRTHVFKLFGSYRLSGRLTAGTFFTWQSGTPLSELGGISVGAPYSSFIRQRGSAGRTPALWDWNLRFACELGAHSGALAAPKLLLDLFHVGNPRKPVRLDQVHYSALDDSGNQTAPNPNYGKAKSYQPPMSARLALVLGF